MICSVVTIRKLSLTYGYGRFSGFSCYIVNFRSSLHYSHRIQHVNTKQNKILQTVHFTEASLLSVDKMIEDVSADKSKCHVNVDGHIHQNGYILFYVQMNQKTVSYCRKT